MAVHVYRRARRLVGVVAVAALVLAACSGTDEEAAPTAADEAADEEEDVEEADADEGTTGEAMDFPTRPIEVVAPFSPGGGADNMARMISSVGADFLPVPLRIVSMPGAGGTVGSAFVADAEPDGYTLLFGTYGALGSSPFLEDTGYTLDDFSCVARAASVPYLVIAGPDSPFETFADVIDFARENPGELSYASTGAGASAHFMMEIISDVADIELTHVPYDGGAEAVAAALGGFVDLGLGTLGNIEEPHNEGLGRALAVSTPERLDALEEVPTFAETGVEDFEFGIWRVLCAPAGTPEPVLEYLDDFMGEVAQTETFQTLATNADGVPPLYLDRMATQEFLSNEMAFIEPVAERILADS